MTATATAGAGRASRLPPVLLATLTLVPALYLLVFFAWPVSEVVRRGLGAGGVVDVLRDPDLRSIAWFTTWQAALSTVLTLAVGLPGAYVLSRYAFPGRRVVTALVTVPFVLPTVVVGAAFLALLPDRFHGTVAAVLVAHVFFNYAVVVRVVGGRWANLDPGYGEAARTLGAGPLRTFAHVTLPLLRPALTAAASIVFLFTFTSFGVVLLLGGPRHPTLEVEIYRRTAQLLDLEGAAALAVLQLLFVGVLLTWWSRSQERRAVAQRLEARAVAARPVRGAGRRTMLAANLGFMAVLLGVPMAALVVRSFATPNGWGLAYYRALGREGRGTSRFVPPLDAVATSLRYAVAATLVAVVIGGMASLAIAARGPGGRLLDAGLMLPLGTSAVTVGFGMLLAFDTPPLDLRSSRLLVPLAHALVATPFVVRALLPVLRSIDPRLRDAASTLGASPWRAWRHVDLAIGGRALLVGAAFAFAVSLGEFGATAFLARADTPTLPVLVVRLLGRPGDLNVGQAYALATILMVVTAAVLLAVELVRREESSPF